MEAVDKAGDFPQRKGRVCAGNPRRDTPSAQAKQRILCIRCLGAFLETSSLDPPPAALRLFPCAIKILSFQNFYKVLETCSAGRKNFFDTLNNTIHPDGVVFLDRYFTPGSAWQSVPEPDGAGRPRRTEAGCPRRPSGPAVSEEDRPFHRSAQRRG